MKCPSCQMVCSDLRDLCPRCMIDLRPHKRVLNLPITNPKASYEELVGKASGKGPGAISNTSPSLGSVVKSFFGPQIAPEQPSESKPQNILASQISSTSAPIAPSPRVADNPAPQQILSSEQELEVRLQNAFGALEEELVSTHQIPARSIPPETPEPLQIAPPPLKASSTVSAAGDDARAANLQSQIEQTPVRVLPARTLPPGFDDVQIQLLFNQAQSELRSHDFDQSSEFQLEQLATLSNREDIKLLFDMSYDAILNPESEKRYVEQVKVSEHKQLESSILTQQLAKVEKVISAPVLGLKAMRAKRAAKAAEDEKIQLQKLVAAPAPKRLRAFAWDLALILFASCLIASTYSMLENPLLLSRLFDKELFGLADLAVPLGSIALLLITLSVLYPLVSQSVFNATLGQKIEGLRLLRQDGRAIKASNLLVYTLVSPLSLALLGSVPVLFGRAAWHDRLAKTALFNA